MSQQPHISKTTRVANFYFKGLGFVVLLIWSHWFSSHNFFIIASHFHFSGKKPFFLAKTFFFLHLFFFISSLSHTSHTVVTFLLLWRHTVTPRCYTVTLTLNYTWLHLCNIKYFIVTECDCRLLSSSHSTHILTHIQQQQQPNAPRTAPSCSSLSWLFRGRSLACADRGRQGSRNTVVTLSSEISSYSTVTLSDYKIFDISKV